MKTLVTFGAAIILSSLISTPNANAIFVAPKSITGIWKANAGFGTLKLKIVGAIGTGVDGFEQAGATGATFGGSKWFQPCHDPNRSNTRAVTHRISIDLIVALLRPHRFTGNHDLGSGKT